MMGAAPAALEQEVLNCFTAYEAALMAGDPAGTDAWFADDPRTVRFGIGEESRGVEELRRWRRTAPPVPPGRRLSQTHVDLWADDLAVVTTIFDYPSSAAVGRQSQTWHRTDAGWRIIHAHVSQRV